MSEQIPVINRPQAVTGKRGLSSSRRRWPAAVALVAIGALVGGTAGALVRGGDATTLHRTVALGPEPSITVHDRATVTTAIATLAPTISLNGRVTMAQRRGRYVVDAEVEPVEAAYRLTTPPAHVTASIMGGPDAVPCLFAGTRPSEQPNGSVVLSCTLPQATRAVPGLRVLVVAQLGKPRQVLSLPMSAVRGDEQQGQVVVVPVAGTAVVRSVALGVHDGLNVEIVRGLTAGDRVLARPVRSDFGDGG